MKEDLWTAFLISVIRLKQAFRQQKHIRATEGKKGFIVYVIPNKDNQIKAKNSPV